MDRRGVREAEEKADGKGETGMVDGGVVDMRREAEMEDGKAERDMADGRGERAMADGKVVDLREAATLVRGGERISVEARLMGKAA